MLGVWMERGSLRLRHDLPVPEPSHEQARILVLRAGICGTDRALLDGYAGFAGVPGHEFVGEVETGPDSLMGRRVVGDINVGCGDCTRCRTADPHHCDDRRVLGIRGLHGAFAQYLVLPVANLVAVPDSIDDGLAALAEPFAAALRIADQVEIDGRRVAIVGDGSLGQLAARALAARADAITVVGRHPAKLARLADLASVTTRLADEPVRPHDVAIDCTGRPEGFAAARALTRPAGTLVVKSTYHRAIPIDLASLVIDEVRVVGSRCGSLATAIHALTLRPFDAAAIVDAVMPLERARDGFERAAKAATLKVQLTTR